MRKVKTWKFYKKLAVKMEEKMEFFERKQNVEGKNEALF